MDATKTPTFDSGVASIAASFSCHREKGVEGGCWEVREREKKGLIVCIDSGGGDRESRMNGNTQ